MRPPPKSTRRYTLFPYTTLFRSRPPRRPSRPRPPPRRRPGAPRSEEHTSELQSRNDISYAVFCLKKKKDTTENRLRRAPGKSNLIVLLTDGFYIFFFFNDTATTEIYTSLHTLPYTTLFRSRDAHPCHRRDERQGGRGKVHGEVGRRRSEEHTSELQSRNDISYAVFCLKK